MSRGSTPEDRWTAMLDAATEVFAEHGYVGASLEDVAQRIGIRKATLYHYVASKEELLYGVELRGHQDLLLLIRESEAVDRTATERLDDFIRRFLAHTRASGASYGRLGPQDVRYLTGQHAETILNFRSELYEFVRAILNAGSESGEFVVPRDERYVINGLLTCLYRTFRWYPKNGPLKPIADWYMRLLVCGCAPTPSPT